jgi:hypothetical protein
MQRHPLNTILRRPALHLLLALAFAVAFCWPILAMTRPGQTFHFLYVSWMISLVALFAISRAAPADSAEAPNHAEDQPDGSTGAGQDDVTRESL